jgi:two-component system response regulator AtoC
LRKAVRDFERRHISDVLACAGGDKVKAARRLGIGLSSLYRKLDEMGMMMNGSSHAPVNFEE